MTDVVITSAARTAIGSYGKSLAGVAPDQVDHVVFGNVIHTEPGDMYMGRVVGMKAGVPKEVPAYSVNRLCGTGVQAIVSACQSIQTGEASVALAGGAESMSRGPYWMPSARWGARMGEAELIDPVMGGLTDPFHSILMGVTAENLAEKHGISRERQDTFAVESHRRAAAARAEGRFDDQIVPVPVKLGRDTVEFTRDEHIREDVSPELMGKLGPVFKRDGTVTAVTPPG